MKALSLTQPWAWLVVHAGKTVENRKWSTNFRGEFLIHAAKKMTLPDYYAAGQTQMDVCGLTNLPIVYDFDALRGGIVGVATLVGVYHPGRKEAPWHFEDQYGFKLADIRPLPFVACKGALGFWTVPADIARACGVSS